MNRITAIVLVLVVLCSGCTGARGTVPVDAILPTWESLEPYTRAGIAEDPDLTQAQRENLAREHAVSLEMLRGAATESTPVK